MVRGYGPDADGDGRYDPVDIPLEGVTIVRIDPVGNSRRSSQCILVKLGEGGTIQEYVYGPTWCDRVETCHE